MPVTPTEIMIAKVWSMGLVVLVATAVSMTLVVRGAIGVPIEGSMLLFFTGVAASLFASTSMGIFLATVARSMPQFGLLLVLTLMPLQMLSGGSTPRESMPEIVQTLMLAAPTTHFVSLSQAILYRGAGIETVWPSLLALFLIGAALFNSFLEETGLPQMLIEQIQTSGLSPLAVMVLILIFYVVLGCFMDSMSMILLTVPLLAPVALELDYNLVWFGIVVVTVAEIGLITPPIGMNLFVVQAAAGNVQLSTVVRGILPFILADFLRLALLVAFPALVLWLPGAMF